MKVCIDCGIKERTPEELALNARRISFYDCIRCGAEPLCEDCSDHYSNVPGCEHEKEKSMKKKVIALVVDTALTNEQLEKLPVYLEVVRSDVASDEGTCAAERLEARNIRVLDAD